MKIELLDHCASDLAVANAARVSVDKWHDEFVKPDDEALIRFLMKNRHGSPFEHGYFRWRVEAPIFVFREWHRHRVGHSYNEMSGRYTEMEEKFYQPEALRMQVGKPGSYTFEKIARVDTRSAESELIMQSSFRTSWHAYQDLLARGVAKEQARAVLPLGLYSKMIWSCNPRSLMHFLSLRCDPQAMQEIRELAMQVAEKFSRIMPATFSAFVANGNVAP